MKLNPGWKFGALLSAEVVAAASVLAYANAKSPNTNRGTYALGANKTTGKGGVDVDVAIGASLVLVGAALLSSKYASYAPHVVAVGAGALATYGSRTGALVAYKRRAPPPPPPPPTFRVPAVQAGNPDAAWEPISMDTTASATPYRVSIK